MAKRSKVSTLFGEATDLLDELADKVKELAEAVEYGEGQEEEPAPRRRRDRDEEEEEPAPRGRIVSRERDEEEEEPAPRRSARRQRDEEEEEPAPRRRDREPAGGDEPEPEPAPAPRKKDGAKPKAGKKTEVDKVRSAVLEVLEEFEGDEGEKIVEKVLSKFGGATMVSELKAQDYDAAIAALRAELGSDED